MKIGLVWRTVKYLRIKQIVYQLKYRIIKRKLSSSVCTAFKTRELIMVAPIVKYACYDGDEKFTFLNINQKMTSWNDDEQGMLWAYNLNYMDWLGQEGISINSCEKWIDKFISEWSVNEIGNDPYPLTLRGMNWIKLFVLHPECRTDERDIFLYKQYKLLECKLEYHLMGNHLLENAFSLFMASLYFDDLKMLKRAWLLMKCELNEQILADGAHYEQSTMYHCILLDRLLDCYNVLVNNMKYGEDLELIESFLKTKAQLMLGHLESIIYNDGTIPLLNDAAYGIAPEPIQIFDYAKRLEISWKRIELNECGYRRLTNSKMEVLIDVGNICAVYQPGHSHADTFNYEMRVHGIPLVVDTGISTYEKTARRQYERSTRAHNTVTVNGWDSSEVWGGFRVGRRANVKIFNESTIKIDAEHDGFPNNIHKRCFTIGVDYLEIEDKLDVCANAISYIHLAEGEKVEECSVSFVRTSSSEISIQNAYCVEIVEDEVAVEYNRFKKIKIVVIHFSFNVKYKIMI